MASTPDTSFSSDDFHHHPRAAHCRQKTLSRLPSSQASDNSCTGTEDALEAIAHHNSVECDDTDDREIEQVYQTIWSTSCGRPGKPAPTSNPKFHFQRGQRSYERLYRRLGQHKGLLAHFEETRKDWNATTGVLVLRIMPARPLHDIFQNTLFLAIEKELDRVAESNPALRPFRKKLCPGGNAAIEKRTSSARSRPPEFEKSPDGQWLWAGSRYPPFVFEVAYSQEDQSLVEKVTQFFEQLPNGICNILGFDIEYAERSDRKAGHFHTASLSLWSSKPSGDELRVTRKIKRQVFRDGNGRSLPGELRLPFALFVPFREHDNLPPLTSATDVCLSFACLCELVDHAERQQRVMEASASPSPALEPPPKRLKRVTFHDADGTVTRDTDLSKRQRTVSQPESPLARTRSQTRSASQPRRSGRVRSRSRGAQS